MKLKMRKINKNSPIPLYYQLREEIIRLIKNGDLLPKEKLPAERELSSFHGVSRMTINKAINELVKSDYLIRQQGRGTFVRELPDQFSISPLASFSEQ